MGEISAIKEYYLRSNGLRLDNGKDNVSNNELLDMLTSIRNEQQYHLNAQDKFLAIIKDQSKPQLGQQFLVNLTANAVWDGLLYFGSKMIKL